MKIDRFRMVSDMEEGAYQRFQVAACPCGFEERVKDTTRNGAPPEMIRRKFIQKGWAMGSRASDDRCPRCVAKKPAAKKPTTETTMPDAPRQPSTDDKRRIREALFSHYDEEKGTYTGSHSDRSLASSLNVPFAWVSTTREALGFGPDKNEAQAAFTTETLAIRADLKAAQDSLLAQFDALEKRLQGVERAGYRTPAA